MSKCRFILVILSFQFQNAFAQQNNIWYFGKKAGLNFNQPGPLVLHNSKMDADEGSASICDSTGNLLFYTNGVTVYNRNHQVMLNGDGLLGNISSVQSVIIVPKPGNGNLYYIFTTDAIENSFTNGYNYSIADMTRDNGNGEILTKNNLLSSSCTERMAAVRHADGISVWLITNDKNSNIFRVWLIDCSGIHTSPVVSVSGIVLDTYELMNTGMMKISPDGKQLCQTHFPNDAAGDFNFFQLFDFNNATGIISNARAINFINVQITSCEYSPNSKLLYLARPNNKAIDQVEATLATTAAIVASRIIISTGNAGFYGIQLAPDQKIYLSQPSSFLGAINNPDIKGPGCNFKADQIDVNDGMGSIAFLGLPLYINDLSFNGSNGFNYTILDSCTGKLQFNGVSSIPGALTWNWDFGDGSTANIQNPIHTFNPADKDYIVKIEITSSGTCGTIRITKNILPKGIVSNIDFDFFASCDSGYVRFTNKNPALQNAGGQYAWYFGDGNISTMVNPFHTYNQPGSYPVKLKLITTNQCLDDSLTKTVSMPALPLTISDHRTIFSGQKIQLFVNAPGNNTYLWSPSNGLSNPAAARPFASPMQDITYKVKVTNDKGCSGEDSVHFTVVDLDGIYVPSAFTPNNDGKNDNIKPFFGSKITLREFSIFNRWGNRVFTTSNRGDGWTGKINGLEQNPGVYIWILKYTNDTGKTLDRKGSLILIR